MKKISNLIVGLLIIFSILFLSELILKLLKIPFPSSILGIIFLFVLLKIRIIKEDLIKDICDFFLKYMILFFIPIFVGIIDYFDILSQNLLPILITLFITTTLVILTVALFVDRLIVYQRFLRIKKRGMK